MVINRYGFVGGGTYLGRGLVFKENASTSRLEEAYAYVYFDYLPAAFA
ncbi:hypothetical protein FM107_10490 [Sphingobacterium sp. JB170]|nr:hypothetical protein FM107_10490 [Sphingobacterium sp. JB170]